MSRTGEEAPMGEDLQTDGRSVYLWEGGKQRTVWTPIGSAGKNDECTADSVLDVGVHLSVISGGGKMGCRAVEKKAPQARNVGRLVEKAI